MRDRELYARILGIKAPWRVEGGGVEVLDHDRLRSKAEYEIDMVGVDRRRAGRTLKHDLSVRLQIELRRKLRRDAGL